MSFGRGNYGRGKGGGGFKSFKPKPVEVGKEYDVTISEVSRRGDGIARIEGFIVFVPGTKGGGHVRIKVTQVSERFATGAVISEPGESGSTAPSGGGSDEYGPPAEG